MDKITYLKQMYSSKEAEQEEIETRLENAKIRLTAEKIFYVECSRQIGTDEYKDLEKLTVDELNNFADKHIKELDEIDRLEKETYILGQIIDRLEGK